MLGRLAVALGLQHPREKLLGGLAREQVLQVVFALAGQHQARLQLQQRGDQDEELRRDLEIQLALGLEVIEIADDDVGELDLQQIYVLFEDERQEQVKGPGENLQVEFQLFDDPCHALPNVAVEAVVGVVAK